MDSWRFLDAVMNGDISEIRRLLDEDVVVSGLEIGYALMYIAFNYGGVNRRNNAIDIEILRLLFTHPKTSDITNRKLNDVYDRRDYPPRELHPRWSSTLLIEAYHYCRFEIVHELLLQGAYDQKVKDECVFTMALAKKDINTIRLLLKRPNNIINTTYEDRESSILMMAIRYHNVEVVKLLLNAKVNMEIQDKFHETALDRAMIWGDLEMAVLVLEAGAVIHHPEHFFNKLLQKNPADPYLLEALQYLSNALENNPELAEKVMVCRQQLQQFTDVYRKKLVETLDQILVIPVEINKIIGDYDTSLDRDVDRFRFFSLNKVVALSQNGNEQGKKEEIKFRCLMM